MKMSEEEIEVLEKLEMAQSLNMKVQLETEQIVILCNLVEKQQKEIEDLKEKHKTTEQMNENLIEALKDSISKDKIREKIEELKYYKKQIPQDKIFYYSEKDYISKDKIREKIKELEKQEIKLENTSEFIISDIIQPKIDILKELLEE